jgi:hypothetical protein
MGSVDQNSATLRYHLYRTNDYLYKPHPSANLCIKQQGSTGELGKTTVKTDRGEKPAS